MEGINVSEDVPEIKDSFDEQWSHPEKVTVGKEEFDVYDISPEEDKLKTGRPLVIGLGWSETPLSHKNHIREFVKGGRRVISPDTPHGIESDIEETYPTVELRKMTALVETLKSRGIDLQKIGEKSETSKIDLMGRSEGAMFSILLAYLYPGLVDTLILENPAGLMGETNPSDFFKHWRADMKQQANKEYVEPNPSEMKHESVPMFDVLKQNFLQTGKSVWAISWADMRDMLKDIRANGTKVIVMATTDDKLFPIEKMAGRVEPMPDSITGREKVIPELTTEHVDGFFSIPGTHISYYANPEKFSAYINQTLDTVDANRKKT